MKMKNKVLVMIITAFLLVLHVSGCSMSGEVQAAEDEILLKIQLDVREDIGLLVIDCDIDGTKTSGGISSIDKTMLKRDELLYWTLSQEDYGNPGETVDLTLRFKVITEYCDPNYENIYPEELTMPLEEISWTADFGKNYDITITGDHDSGYQAVLNPSD